MTTPASGSFSTQSVNFQRVAITSVDPVGGTAKAQGRNSSDIPINLQFYVGAAYVIPAVGEQWFIKRYGAQWYLDFKLPWQQTTQNTVVQNPQQGTYQIGSTSGLAQGPLLLDGSYISANNPLALSTNTPAVTTVPTGSLAYNGTVPAYNNGTSWVPIYPVSATNANGFTVSAVNGDVTVGTSVTGLLKGNGTTASAAVAGTDYLAPVMYGAAAAAVATAESTTSTTYTTLTTTSDQVTVTIGASGLAIVFLGGNLNNNNSLQYSYMSFALSGANTVAASDIKAIGGDIVSGYANWGQVGAPFLLTGLTAGATTFKAQYRSTTGTATFSNRRIEVIPL